MQEIKGASLPLPDLTDIEEEYEKRCEGGVEDFRTAEEMAYAVKGLRDLSREILSRATAKRKEVDRLKTRDPERYRTAPYEPSIMACNAEIYEYQARGFESMIEALNREIAEKEAAGEDASATKKALARTIRNAKIAGRLASWGEKIAHLLGKEVREYRIARAPRIKAGPYLKR